MDQLLHTRLIHRHRRRARLLLYLVPAALLGLGWAYVSWTHRSEDSGPWKDVDFRQYESVRLFQRYLQINTSYPTGNEIPGAEFFARELSKDGFEARVERIGHRNANVWAILEGENPGALVLHNHIDVDPLRDPGAWRHPAMSGTIELPFIYGRGAFDMKSLAIAQLMAMKKLRREGVRPARSLVFLAVGDEERDGWFGTRWFLRQHEDLVKRFDVVLTEGGAIEATDLDEVKYWGTETRQKLYVDLWVCDDNRAALEALREDLTRPEVLTRGHPDRLPDAVVEAMRQYVSTRERPDFKLIFESALFWRGGFDLLPANVQAPMRHDLSAFPVEDDPDGGGYQMRVILQLLPWVPVEDGIESLFPGGLPAFSTAVHVPHGPLPVTLDHPIFEHISTVLEEAYPGFVHGPLFVPWAATDARFFRAAGIPAYGFSPFIILSGDASKMTGPNERMAAPSFIDGVEVLEDVVRSWLESPADSP